MSLQKIAVNSNWQSILLNANSSVWTEQEHHVYFSSGGTSPDETGIFSLLSPGIENKLIFSSNTLLWFRADYDSFILIDDQVE